jgi:hypothetical protein
MIADSSEPPTYVMSLSRSKRMPNEFSHGVQAQRPRQSNHPANPPSHSTIPSPVHMSSISPVQPITILSRLLVDERACRSPPPNRANRLSCSQLLCMPQLSCLIVEEVRVHCKVPKCWPPSRPVARSRPSRKSGTD